MRIAYISSAIIPSRTANSINVMKMCQAYSKNGHEVKLFVPLYEDFKSKFKSEKDVFNYYDVEQCFEIEWLPIKKTLKLAGHFYGFKAILKARRWNAELVHGRSLLLIILLSSFFANCLYELHQPLSDKFFPGILKLLTKINHNKVVVISNSLKKYCLEEYGIDEKKIIVAHDGADSPSSPKKISSGRDFPNNKFTVGYIGHLYPGKGMEILSHLIRYCKWAEFHIVGGMESDIEYWKDILEGEDNVVFHGFVPHNQTEQYRQSCDVLIAPYLRQVSVYGNRGGVDVAKWMSPLKLFEYMASNKAIVSSDLPVLKEVLQHEENSLLCNPDDINDWSMALERLHVDHDLRNKLSENANRDFNKNYTWRARAKKVIDGVHN